ncbi:MAG: hypothetical protein ACOCVA_04750 [Prolixibacteraceae bacterium]
MDDLLLIILMIVVSVIGALGQINKKKKSAQQENLPEENKDNFWDFLNEEAYGQEEQQEEEVTEPEEPVFEPVKQPGAQPEIKKPEYRFSAENEGQSIYNTEITDLREEDKGKTKKKLKDFSLRKAVIYNEILNRKYE